MTNYTKKLVVAFDLDGTLIDSSHRITYKEDGSFDLDAWIRDCKEKTKDDILLPLADVYFAYKAAGFTIIAVTAREMHKEDFDYLDKNELDFDLILHREGSTELDHVLKNRLLNDFFEEEGRIPFQAYDDKQDNLEVFDAHGFRTFHATYLNKAMKAEKRDLISVTPKMAVLSENGDSWGSEEE